MSYLAKKNESGSDGGNDLVESDGNILNVMRANGNSLASLSAVYTNLSLNYLSIRMISLAMSISGLFVAFAFVYFAAGRR